MRVCMVVHDPQDFGGIEEAVVTVAAGLLARGCAVSVVTDRWTPPDNQYVSRLRDHGVTWVQAPRWLSQPASHWPTKMRLLTYTLWLMAPLIGVLAIPLRLLRHDSWRAAAATARNWVRGQLTERVFRRDRSKPLTRAVLTWWRLRWRPDILHVQGYTNSLLFVVDWAYRHGLPTVYQEHQTPVADFDWWNEFPATINKADVVVAVSKESAQALRSICGVTQPIEVRHPPLPDPYGPGQTTAGRHVDSSAIRITTVGRLYVTKGLTYLLESAAEVKKRYPGAEFRVYGDGVLRDELVTQAGQLGLDGEGIFVGAFTTRDDLNRIMTGTDIFLMPSILEGQPMALVEAMAYGCAIVATRVGGIPEVIEDGVNGLLCPPADPAALTECLVRLIEDPERRAALGRAARTSYEHSPFQAQSVCDSFVSLYRVVLNGQTRTGGLPA